MNGVTLVILVAPVVFVLVVVRKRGQRSRVRAATVSIQADSAGVRRTLADGRTEEVGWDEVNEVEAFRTRVGPHKPAGGGVVLYGTADRGCIIPFDKLEESSLLVHVNHLPGFDVGSLIAFVGADQTAEAAATTTLALLTPKPLHTTVTLWTRPGTTGAGGEPIAEDHEDDPHGGDDEPDGSDVGPEDDRG